MKDTAKNDASTSHENSLKHIIHINSRDFVWNNKHITFEEVVTLFYGSISNDPNIAYTVSYTEGIPPNDEGDLVRKQQIKVKNKMQFHVTHTGRS